MRRSLLQLTLTGLLLSPGSTLAFTIGQIRHAKSLLCLAAIEQTSGSELSDDTTQDNQESKMTAMSLTALQQLRAEGMDVEQATEVLLAAAKRYFFDAGGPATVDGVKDRCELLGVR